uniref:Peroxidase n=1 Tax=Oryza brachyantha TaxID=4533 RepID=J3LB84_ORYBR
MASGSHSWHCCLLLAFFLVFSGADGLSTAYYATSCPSLQQVVRATVSSAIQAERRIGASLIRLFFHDCFVQACDASILLDDVPETGFVGEKTAGPNVNSVRGYEVIDRIKANVEDVCPGVVSCADIVALAARDSTALLGGRTGGVPPARLDSTTASLAEANRDLPGPDSDLGTLIARFGAKGLSPRDMTALSGSHTVGFSQCTNFRAHIYNDTDIDPAFAALRRRTCPPPARHAHLQRHRHRPGVRGAAPPHLPRRRRQRRLQPGAARRADAERVRQRLLPQPARPAWPAPLRPGALQRRLAGRAGAAVQLQPVALRRRLRQGHGQDGEPVRSRRRGQVRLQGRQRQLIDSS